MKKQICFILAFIMLFSINILQVHAQGGDLDEYASYTVTVPAKLSPGESGLVTLSGAWASHQTIKITTDNTIILTNTQDTSATINIGITFAGIEKSGSNTGPQTITETISVETVNVLFGTWTGVINYNVEVIEKLMNFSVGGWAYFQAPAGRTWGEFIDSKYNVELNDTSEHPTHVEIIWSDRPGIFWWNEISERWESNPIETSDYENIYINDLIVDGHSYVED